MLWGGRETYNDNPLRARAMWQTQIIKLQQTFQKKKGLLLQKKKKEIATICQALETWYVLKKINK